MSPQERGIPTVEEIRPRNATEARARLRHVEARVAALSDELAANQREYETLNDSYRVFLSEHDALRRILSEGAA